MTRPHDRKPSKGTTNTDPVSMYQIIFGSCGGVIEAASCFMLPKRTTPRDFFRERRVRKTNSNARTSSPVSNGIHHINVKPKSTQDKQHFLKLSKEVVDYPEFLDPNFGNYDTYEECSEHCDEISALSAHTLEAMANTKSILTKTKRPKSKVYASPPPSPTSTAASMSTDGGDKYDMPDNYMMPSSKVKKDRSNLTKDRSNLTQDSAYFSYTSTIDLTTCSSITASTIRSSPPSNNNNNSIWRTKDGKTLSTERQNAWI